VRSMMTLLSKEELLKRVPQQTPFRFIDEIVSIDDENICTTYTFKDDESFYAGHFPGRPVTPGVILLECCAQAGIVALGLYLAAKEVGLEKVEKMVTLFTDANIEFTGMVKPGEKVMIKAKKIFFRRMKIRSEVECTLEDGTCVLRGTISGMGVIKP